MPSRLGRPNKDKLAIREMAAKHGVDVLEMQVLMVADLKKSYDFEVNRPRSRRSKQFFTVEDKLAKMLEALTPYFYGRMHAVDVTAEATRTMVIRTPETIRDKNAWLDKYAPKDITPEPAKIEPPKPQPTMEQFVPTVRAALHVADSIGDQSAQEVLDSAKRFAVRTEDKRPENISYWDRKFLAGY
jgi:hypothetical protein